MLVQRTHKTFLGKNKELFTRFHCEYEMQAFVV